MMEKLDGDDIVMLVTIIGFFVFATIIAVIGLIFGFDS